MSKAILVNLSLVVASTLVVLLLFQDYPEYTSLALGAGYALYCLSETDLRAKSGSKVLN